MERAFDNKYENILKKVPERSFKDCLVVLEWNGFVLDKNQLIPTAKETWAGVSVVLDEIVAQYLNSQAKGAEANVQRQKRCSDRLDGCRLWVEASPGLCAIGYHHNQWFETALRRVTSAI
ncbi:hypothetical protein OSTOST_18065 [Ostertagia ostertagi]